MGFRQRRVSDELRVRLAELLMHEIKDPRLGFVTVTEVRVSSDLSHARVFVSIMGGEEEEQSALAALRSARGFLRREIGRRVRLRHTPELHFEVDRTLDHSERIETLLQQALPESDERESDGGAQGEPEGTDEER